MVFRLPGVVEHYNFLISVRKGKVVGIDVGDSHGLAHVPQVIRQEGFPVVPHRVDEPYYVPGGVAMLDDVEHFSLPGSSLDMVVERHRLHSVAVLQKFLIQRLERASLKSVQVTVGVRGLKETFIFLRSHVGPARNRCQVPVYVVNNGAIVLFGDVLDIRGEVLRPLDVSNLDLRFLLPLLLELFKIHFFCCHDHGMRVGAGALC